MLSINSVPRSLLVPAGRSQIRRMIEREGLPGPIREPLEYLATGKLSPEDLQLSNKIESLRSELLSRGDEIFLMRTGAETDPHGKLLPPSRKLGLLAAIYSVPAHWGMFLHLIAKAARARVILELGSCVGISGCYLASSPACTTFVTIEGAAQLIPIVESNLSRVTGHGTVIHAAFDQALDSWLPKLRESLDLVYIDGDHGKTPTLHYLERVRPHLRPGSIIVFDDIFLTPDMRSAWQDLSRWKGFSHTVDVGRFGVCIWTGTMTRPVKLSLRMLPWAFHLWAALQ